MCQYCELIKKEALYKDEKIAIILDPKPATTGHLLVLPVEHKTILEEVPDFVVDKLFIGSNKASSLLFDLFPEVQGTNILIENGVAAGQEMPHLALNVIPRKENDGLNLIWQPKQFSEEEMSTIELKLKEETTGIGVFEKEAKTPEVIEEAEKIEIGEDEEDYRIKQLRRIP